MKISKTTCFKANISFRYHHSQHSYSCINFTSVFCKQSIYENTFQTIFASLVKKFQQTQSHFHKAQSTGSTSYQQFPYRPKRHFFHSVFFFVMISILMKFFNQREKNNIFIVNLKRQIIWTNNNTNKNICKQFQNHETFYFITFLFCI